MTDGTGSQWTVEKQRRKTQTGDVTFVVAFESQPLSVSTNYSAVRFNTDQATLGFVASELAQFGPQAPAPRSVAAVAKPAAANSSATYPALKMLRHKNTTITSAASAEHLVLKRAAVNGALQVVDGRFRAAGADDFTQAVFDRVYNERRLVFKPRGRTDFRTKRGAEPTVDLVAPTNSCAGLLSQDQSRQVLVNGGYWIWLEEEAQDPFSWINDPIGLCVQSGLVTSAPVYPRSGLLVYSHQDGTESRRIERVSLESYAVQLPAGTFVSSGYGNAAKDGVIVAGVNVPADSRGTVIYTRQYGQSDGAQGSFETPEESGRHEFVVSGMEICGVGLGGGSPIPLNGYVLSAPDCAWARQEAERLLAGGSIQVHHFYGSDKLRLTSAAQMGPILIHGGERVDLHPDRVMLAESYLPSSPSNLGYPPIALDHVRLLLEDRARTAIGLTADGAWRIVGVEGCEPRSLRSDVDQLGASVTDVQRLLLDLGCVEALACDSGGAAAIYFDGAQLLRPSDRNDVVDLPAERVVPAAWKM